MDINDIIEPKKEIQKPPVTVKAPIVLDVDNLSEYEAFVASLEAHTNVEVAEAESERLGWYFNAAKNYLKKVPDKETESTLRLSEYNRGSERGLIDPITTTESLRGIFEAMAAKTHNTIISDITILPLSIINIDSMRKTMGFNSNYSYGAYRYNFGFLQVFKDGHIPPKVGPGETSAPEHANGSSVAIPIFLIDARITDFV